MVDEDALLGKIRDNGHRFPPTGCDNNHPNHGARRPAVPARSPDMSRAFKGPLGVKR
jgi:hypothetical protein